MRANSKRLRLVEFLGLKVDELMNKTPSPDELEAEPLGEVTGFPEYKREMLNFLNGEPSQIMTLEAIQQRAWENPNLAQKLLKIKFQKLLHRKAREQRQDTVATARGLLTVVNKTTEHRTPAGYTIRYTETLKTKWFKALQRKQQASKQPRAYELHLRINRTCSPPEPLKQFLALGNITNLAPPKTLTAYRGITTAGTPVGTLYGLS